jgi:hypothetical protein
LDHPKQINQPDWFAETCAYTESVAHGFRHMPGGVHLSKTMMLDELQKVLDLSGPPDGAAVEDAILNRNILSKPTGTARKLVLSRLNTLYGIRTPLPLQTAMLKLWTQYAAGHPLLALLCTLAREPLLRDTVSAVLNAPRGAALRWPELAESLEAKHPGRYSQKMLKSLAQNCASSWTQSGHLKGKVAKRRSLAEPTAHVAAYAALLGSLAGFGGPALLASPWMRVLDRPEADLLGLLRRAEGAGLVQLRAGGGVIQVNVRRPLSQVLGVPALADG